MFPRYISCSPGSVSYLHLTQPFFLQLCPNTPHLVPVALQCATTSQVKVTAPPVGSHHCFLPWATKITGARKNCSDWGPGSPSLALPKSFQVSFSLLNLLFDLEGGREL